LADLRDTLADAQSTDRRIDEAIRKVESELTQAKRRFPSDGHLLILKSKLGAILEDSQRATIALERAFHANTRDPHIASRLASYDQRIGRDDDAIAVLGKALERKRGDRRLHFHYGELLRRMPTSDAREMSYHYRRAYTPGDGN